MTSRILIIEDSPTQAQRLRLLLAREGYEVEVALTGKEGLAKVEPRCPDLVISDVMMPEIDGFEFCRTMKSSEKTRRVPIILLTAQASPADVIKGLECGADNFIPKPYDDDYLLERVRRIFEQLEHRKRGRLDMEVNLTIGTRRITVSADRQQIMELLFSTFEEVSKSHDELARANQELQKARAEADRANRAKSRFLSRMSHELRTPLNAVIGFGHLLEMTDLEPQDQESVNMIIKAGRHLLDIINEVLDIGRIDAGELTLSVEPVRIRDVLQEAVDLVAPLAADRQVAIDGDLVTCDVIVMADRQRLKQVMLNLLSNAVKYNRPEGTVTLSCREGDSGRHRIEVADTGPGIAPENLDRLFTPFDRIGAEQDTAVEGTGLGLTLSRGLVEAMGGTLGVESEVGRGSTFWVELPPAEDQLRKAEQDQPGPLPRPAGAPRTPATILYIEDNQPNLTLVERILAHRPEIKLITALHGRLGFNLARAQHPDMILLDLNLPDVSGEELLKQLRAEPDTHTIPVVIVTADASAGRAKRFRSLGACAYLTKPFDVARVLEVIDETLGSRHREQGPAQIETP
jgi:signal transduction histidine kinase